ncbi:MAG: acetyltransferase [Frankiales bacterium]|nr:acetyltransferase [Frankiales bacterium]
MLLPIHFATWTADVSPGPTPAPSEALLDVESIADVLVAEEEGVVSGYVRLNQPGPLPSHAHVLVINGLAVAPARQGSGIGRRLMASALEEARSRGARKVSLRVLAPNARARRLYEACGFSIEGVLRGEFLLNGEYVDDVVMAAYLDAGATV